ncbi:hypothetical protein GQ54DRAFT_298422, partial [Martensiomyces pterosporus]
MKLDAVNKLRLLNYRYELVMGLYVMEAWEKMVVNAFVLLCLAFVVRFAVSSIPVDSIVDVCHYVLKTL